MSHLMISISLLGVATLTSITSTLIMYAMIGEINRKKNDSSQISYFVVDPYRVVREYRALYPNGVFTKILIASVSLTVILFLILVYLVFGVFPATAPPSR
jgi:hypothetical protein